MSTITIRKTIVHGARDLRLDPEEYDPSTLAPDQVLVRTEMTGFSTGSEVSAINRLIPAEAGAQLECDILSQSGFYSGGEGPAREFGSWQRPTSRAGPPQSRYCLSHFPPHSTTA